MELILLGILIGWFRPIYLADIEEAIWNPIKKRIPRKYRFLGIINEL